MLNLDVQSLLVGPDDTYKSNPQDFKEFGEEIVAGMERVFADRNVEVNAIIRLRTEDVVASYLLARGIESALHARGVFRWVDKAPDLDGALLPAVDASHKARERLRKAIRELEDACMRAGTPIDSGLPAVMKPIVESGEGVLENAIAFEQAKRRRRPRTKSIAASGEDDGDNHES